MLDLWSVSICCHNLICVYLFLCIFSLLVAYINPGFHSLFAPPAGTPINHCNSSLFFLFFVIITTSLPGHNLSSPILLQFLHPPQTSLPFHPIIQSPPSPCPYLISSNKLLAVLPFLHYAFLIPFNSNTQPLAARHGNPINCPNLTLPGLAATPVKLQHLGHNIDAWFKRGLPDLKPGRLIFFVSLEILLIC